MKPDTPSPRRWLLSVGDLLFLLLGSAILAFGLCHIHSHAAITEGGILGLTLLLQHWLSLSPAIAGFFLNAICYAVGVRLLGRRFLVASVIAGGGFSLFYWLFDLLPPLFPFLASHPLWAAILGALFVGVGAGLCVFGGGAPCGDDALAMSLCHRLRVPISLIYLISDLSVLLLSLTYLPLPRVLCSLLTVVLSGQIIELIQKIPKKETSSK